MWCGDKPFVLRSLDDRCERHKRASRRAWSARWPASPKGRIESEPRGPSQLRGVRGVARIALSQLRIATIRHGLKLSVIVLPCFGHFWLAISEPGWTSRKKVPLGIRLKSTRPSHGRFWSRPLHGKPGKKSTGGAFERHTAHGGESTRHLRRSSPRPPNGRPNWLQGQAGHGRAHARPTRAVEPKTTPCFPE